MSTKPESEVIQQVETFIQRCHDLDYVFTPESRKMVYQASSGDKKLWANVIADAMTLYTLNKDNSNRLDCAETCLGYINKAFAGGLVTEGPRLIARHKQAVAKIAELEAQVKELFNENQVMQAKMELLADAKAI
jgi:hypothetical protein